ncbi:metal ABC transporter solute-binding protein, Zn/Mn family [Tenacibaculum maritimum]|uniref:metal ABC transporter solute-binding protein, Zn/Mn family n=1 Tax=Tenacibaculum maritimum TaxID=107401 RepID=UPI0012E410C1|nr:zinc ABC transporter substrate-binding protein [Tenacibaculum maritimum]MCD9584248.1 zinc ABC transporter substrate-binding protein [Tenacibaculum maritimum]MCD9619681.1 zinc ABC transporter substrate-binding protein [Tenacibaculum maritimum]MCD9625883.1 zinc ABC transporter substrate-binding protein [Tenacibaculum maritimum]MCD9628835.1 zinc ABC transporter substrate-binding protein [Tenacibaculum maritimum]MCD9631897.1 zinc ABC transporter substrate-binding protein [Tenacibaculum maritimu
MKKYYIVIIIVFVILSCKKESKKKEKLQVVTTTTMITDLVKNIGGDKLEVRGLMGAGVDPHLYKASEGDVSKLYNADIVIYNGIHLEGKLEEVFEKMRHQHKKTIAVSEAIDHKKLITSEFFASNYDPHIWFDISNWELITTYLVNQLSELDHKNAETYAKNGKEYLAKLAELKVAISKMIDALPIEKRILVTAHDAFNYFGKAFQFNVVGLQGLSTATEAGVKDVQKMADFIMKNDVSAIFVETSVPKRTVEALQEAVKSKGHEIEIGGTLFSDALGDSGTVEGTYIGMYKHNVKTIVDSLQK